MSSTPGFMNLPRSGGTNLVARSQRRASYGSAAQYVAKRIIDFVGAGFLLIAASPLMLLSALLIRLESGGPILFCQLRMGQGGRPFRFWKFRTMVPDAESRLKDIEHLNESAGGVLFKIKQDPRVTRLGRLLRRTSLDELPQLVHVLQGHMSLVGPRPLQLRDCERLAQVDPTGFARRLEVLPGLTGLWQVSLRSEVGFDQMVHLDVQYIERSSLWLDLRIICQTVWVMLSGRGAC